MASWAAFEAEAPELAAAVRARFEVRKHCTMATLRSDGGPRISGTEVEFAGGEVRIGVMPGSVKGLDLRRDPRLALHSPTVDPPADDASRWSGEAKLGGAARPMERQPEDEQPAGTFWRIDLTEAVLTELADSGDELQITWWRPGEAVRSVRRR